MCTALFPLAAQGVSADGRAASISVTPIPTAMDVNPGEAGEYTIRVRNTGSDPVTVQISSSQEATEDCNGFSSSVTQIAGQIDSGSYEEAAMNVSVAQTVEAGSSCVTTVTVTITAVIGAPAAEIPEPSTADVTTTAADGSGSAVFGVDLIIAEADRSKDWNGEEELDYRIEVENTGQTNETVNLGGERGNGSGMRFSVLVHQTLSETSVNVAQEESEIVFATVEVPEGASADKYCWEVTGTVTNDPSQEAKDTEDFDLTVPQLKKCTVSLSKTSVSVNPDDDTQITATYANDGNADWTVYASPVGSKSSWVQVDGTSSGLLPYDNGEGERAFDFIVSPDDSVTAGSETVVQIVGKDGNNGPIKCQADLRIIVGQSRRQHLSCQRPAFKHRARQQQIHHVDHYQPGQRPGQPQGCILHRSHRLGGATRNVHRFRWLSPWEREVGNGGGHRSRPVDALATEEIELTFSVLPSSGGSAYDTVSVRVTVAEIHGLEINTPATDQTGRSGTEVRFPIDLINEGNVRDTIGLSVVSQTASPSWGTSFENEDGMPFTEIDIEPQTTTTVYLVVSIDGEEELENTRLTVRVRNKDDPNGQDRDGDGIPDNQREGEFLAVLSDRNFSMDLRLEGTDTATSAPLCYRPTVSKPSACGSRTPAMAATTPCSLLAVWKALLHAPSPPTACPSKVNLLFPKASVFGTSLTAPLCWMRTVNPSSASTRTPLSKKW